MYAVIRMVTSIPIGSHGTIQWAGLVHVAGVYILTDIVDRLEMFTADPVY